MTVYELVEKLHGEIVRGTARVRRGSEYIVLGTLVIFTFDPCPPGAVIDLPSFCPVP